MSSSGGSACSHLNWIRQPIKGSAVVHKEECTQCFHQDTNEGGVDVCLTCFNGGCTGASSLQHSARHAQLCHPIVLNIQRKEIVKSEEDAQMADASASVAAAAAAGEPAAKLSKLAAEAAAPEPDHFYETQARCLACNVNLDPAAHEPLAKCIAAIMEAQSASKPTELLIEEAVEENCPHCASLQQVADPPQLGQRSLTTCASCDVKDKMWLCLTCGALGCSRRQMVGAGQWSVGNGHAVAHSEATGHALVLKVGTLTAEGRGEVYCYKCDNTVVDKELVKHVGTFGIVVDAATVATEQTTAEQMLQLNLSMNWSLVFEEDGREAELAFGPGHTGLANLGNSCYMASVLQVLFSMPHFQERYLAPAAAHLSSCTSVKPAECFRCQMSKLAVGMLSGRHDPQPSAQEMAQIVAEREERNRAIKAKIEGKEGEEAVATAGDDNKKRKKPLQSGVAPRMFKRLVAGKHPEFSSGRQQDSFEYFHFLLDYLKQKEHAAAGGAAAFDPYAPFAFQQEDRLECTACHGVRYATGRNTELSLPIPLPEPLPPKPQPEPKPGEKAKPAPPKEYPPVTFRACMEEWMHAQTVDDWICPACKVVKQAKKSVRLATFPPVLMVHMRRFVYEGWVPEKLDIQVQLMPEAEAAAAQTVAVDFDALRAKGLQEGEVPLPKGEEGAASGGAAAAAAKVPDEMIVVNLESMGFGSNACKRAALAVDNASADAAAAWLMSHMDDADLNDPLPAPAASSSSSSGGANEPSAEAVSNLEMMGFDARRCRHALRQCGNNAERAVEWLFSHEGEEIPDESAGGAAAEKKEDDVVMIDNAPAGYELFAFVTHLGKSTGSGHYVAHVKKREDDRWLLFNDHKVSFVQAPVKAAAAAYLLFFRRIQQ